VPGPTIQSIRIKILKKEFGNHIFENAHIKIVVVSIYLKGSKYYPKIIKECIITKTFLSIT